MLPETAWKATLGELELQMTKATFNTWLKDARLLAYDNEEYVIGVRNDYAKDWLENRLEGAITRTLSAIVDQDVDVRFVVGAAVPAEVRRENGTSMEHAPEIVAGDLEVEEEAPPEDVMHENGSSHGENLSRRYTFATFVVGPSNRLAHAAALSVAEQPGRSYNPLFIYGGVGLGKTHLLHAIGHKCENNGYTVCYVSSETFTNDLIQSIRTRKMEQFREKYRTPDVLLIDDIQFIAGKESTQEEFFHTFNHLHSSGKQVVLSSDRPPKAMVTLEERLQSRFEWGLMTDIQLPDAEMRAAILHAKAEESGARVPESVIEVIAHHFRNNIRELEGALNKVIAFSKLTNQPIDMRLVNMALADQVHRPTKLTVPQIMDAVVDYYRLSEEKLCSRSRSRVVSFPRQIAMYLARTETDASFPQIGQHLGDRDHTTIIHGYEKIAGLMETDEKVRRDVMQIKAALYESAPA
ncbi:MAG: chromosomal replication initiator protein DnaA [Candidatus Promineifilaceae bacterium]|nr:chromosomal replication initiator protein DnaA [Candidatus Promineifilaceae bacterium]